MFRRYIGTGKKCGETRMFGRPVPAFCRFYGVLIADVGDAGTMEEVQSRLGELIDELKRAGAFAEARWFKAQGEGLSHDLEARRTVNRLITRLARFRTGSGEIPETPALLIVVCRLEDACTAVLKAGFVPAARPTWGRRLRRWALLSGFALLAGGGALGLAVAWVDYGHLVWRDRAMAVGPLRLRRGERAAYMVRMSSGPRVEGAVNAVQFEVVGGCGGDSVIGGFVCSRALGRVDAAQQLGMMELKRDQRAYGVEFALVDPRLEAGRGVVTVLASASAQTPPGRYRLRLQGSYQGYGPEPACFPGLDLLGLCALAPDPEGRDLRVQVPELLIEVRSEVLRPRSEERDAERGELEAARAQLEAELLARAAEVEVILTDNERALQQRQHGVLRPRLEQLEALLADHGQEGASGPRLAELRARLAAQRKRLAEADAQLFEALYTALYEHPARAVDEERVIRRLAKRFAVSADEVRFVQLDQAERIAERLEVAAQAQRDRQQAEQGRLGARCGAVPSDTWTSIRALLRQRAPAAGNAESQLLQCLTPRLTSDHCWEVICDHDWVVRERDGSQSRRRERSRFGFAAGQGQWLGSVARHPARGAVAGLQPSRRAHDVQ